MILLLLTIHMMRGTPYIYQGEELGMTNAHYSDISQYRDVESLNYYEILLSEGKSKEEALEILAAKSRDNSRTPMQWSADVNAGFSEAEPWISVIDNYKEINAEKEMQDPDSIYSFYKKLVGLRKEKAVISEGTIEFFERENADVLLFHQKTRIPRCSRRILSPRRTRIRPPINSALLLYLLPKKFPTTTPAMEMTMVVIPMMVIASTIGVPRKANVIPTVSASILVATARTSMFLWSIGASMTSTTSS